MITIQESYNSELELEESFVYEECVYCGRDMTNPEYIYTDLDSGNYCCKQCADIWELNVVLCNDIN